MALRLHECRNLEDLSSIFDLNYHQLASIIYSNSSRYYNFLIPKKGAGYRRISAPKAALKSIQHKLLSELLTYYQPRPSVHGFTKSKSILTNAEVHISKKYVLNIDLKDFFESIHFGRVLYLFKAKPFLLQPNLATVLAQICCLENKLPQGAPTSPIITNMICKKMDSQLQALAKECNSVYSRYADDITFSFTCPKKHLPSGLIQDSTGTVPILGEKLEKIIETNGFKINPSKIRLRSNRQRQRVTGVVVNTRTNVSHEYIKKTKSMLYAWKKFGAENAACDYFAKYCNNSRQKWHVLNNKNLGNYFEKIVAGRIAHISMIRGKADWTSRTLLYKLSVLLGSPKIYLISSKESLAKDSVLIIDNMQETGHQGTGFILNGFGLISNAHVTKNIDNSNLSMLEIYKHSNPGEKYHNLNNIKTILSRDISIISFDNNLKETYGIHHISNIDSWTGQEIRIVGFPSYSSGDTPKVISSVIVASHTIFNIPMWEIKDPLEHGVSGSPVFNTDWELIGIATYGAKGSDISNKCNGFIPIKYALNL